LNCLNENQKRRIILYYFQGLTYRQIAKIDGVSDMSVRESIAGAIKKIKKFL
jgi:RNA polymerase sigma-70 factor (ECF subfamily)